MTIANQLRPYSTPGFMFVWDAALWAINQANRNSADPHYWHRILRSHHDLHPLIDRLVYTHEVRPLDWQLMLLEWPHKSKDDPTCIAYTRNEYNGVDFMVNRDARQTKTTIAKYIARHYPHIPDHIKRDMAGLFQAPDYRIWRTMEEIICGIELGPQSCMKSSYGSVPFTSRDNEALCAWFDGDKDVKVRWDHHPYAVYRPEYGWGMAVQIDKGTPNLVLSRALVYENGGEKCFVRSYVARDNWSESDHTLDAWLKEQGYEYAGRWPEGAKLARVEHPECDGPMLPYIDGDTQAVSARGGYFVIDDCGELTCTNTDGTVDEQDIVGSCDNCGDTVYEGDEYYYAGRHEDVLVCTHCRENSYTYVIGADRHGGQRSYIMHDDHMVEINGLYYDEDNLPSCIITRADGEHDHIDNVVRCETDDEYYESDDEDIVEIDDCYYRKDDDDVVEIDGVYYHVDDDAIVECADGEKRLKDECWQCEHSGDWYSDDEDGVDLDAGKYHPDSLREIADNA